MILPTKPIVLAILLASACIACSANVLGADAQDLSGQLFDQSSPPIDAFAKVERVRRLPSAQQKPYIKEIYEFIRPAMLTIHLGIPDNAKARELLNDRDKYEPRDLAKRLVDAGAGDHLHMTTEATCNKLLKAHLDIVVPLLKEDLASPDTRRAKRALVTIRDLNTPLLLDEVHDVLRNRPALELDASYALRGINDARSISKLIESDKKNPMKHFEILRSLSKNRPADQKLVSQLNSSNPEIRWRAAYALAESGDPALIPVVARLVKDRDALVRQNAANIALCLKDADFNVARPLILPLLKDSDRSVRLFVAQCMAQKRDTACGYALLELVKDGNMKDYEHNNVVQAINNLTGSYFDYYIGSDGWQPSSGKNPQAIQRFADWVGKHCK